MRNQAEFYQSLGKLFYAAAFQIEIVFDWYEENGVTSEESLTSFKTFKHNNPSYSTPGINQMNC